eukprot:symbB.v1.2.000136.t2/scaffold16.1/size461936/10
MMTVSTCSTLLPRCHHSFAAGDSSAQLTPEQSKAVWTGTLIFVCLCILVTVLIVIAYAMVLEDKLLGCLRRSGCRGTFELMIFLFPRRRSTSHDLQMQIRNSKLKYQHSLALNELASSAAPVQDKAMVPMVPFSYMTGYAPALAAGYQDVRQVVLPATVSPYSGRSGVALATPSAPCSPCYTAGGAVVYSRGSASSAGPVTSKPVPQEFTPNSRPMLHKCFQFDPARRIDISEILLTLKGLTPQDLERCGMDVRRIN